MPLVLKTEITDSGVVAAIDGIIDRTKDVEPALKAGGLIIMESVNRNFIEGGRPQKWKDLSPVTYLLRYRNKARFTTYKSGENKRRITKSAADNFVSGGAEPLRDTDALMASIGRPMKGGIYELKPASLAIGTNLPQAAIQNDGGQAKGFIHGSPQIPAREFMLLQPEDEENILNAFGDHIAGGEK